VSPPTRTATPSNRAARPSSRPARPELAQYRKALREAARMREQADEMRSAAMRHLRRWCIRAKQAGMPVTEIAKEAGLSRQSVYELIGDNRA
jgi:AcrR family transcriptional regulator